MNVKPPRNGRANHARFKHRRGTVMAITAVVLPVLAILAAFAINAAHMQLTRTELSIATDAAARSAGRAFSEVQTVDAAVDAAVATAALNTVDGEPLRLRSGDGDGEIEFGTTVQHGGDGSRYHFIKIPTSDVRSGTVASAVRVHGKRLEGSLSGNVPLIIPGLLSTNDFETQYDSVAMQVDRDISLILDRSGSMDDIDFDWEWNENPFSTDAKDWAAEQGELNRWWSGGRWRYSYANGNDSITYQQFMYENYFNKGTAPTNAWQDLEVAVNAFLDVLEGTSQEEQVSLASYSSSATLDTLLEKDLQIVRDTVAQLNTGGNTAIGKGMQEGIEGLIHSRARPFAAKTMVVMTDGNQNQTPWAENVAQTLVNNYLLTIHTVTFGEGANQQDMQEVAAIGGGKHYHAATGEDLVRIFEEIANNLPTILTK
ncbi:von Willebrand factor type A domain protein [Stieleria neptunia]|uniref:von Willebrand factor type A domain protein n=1 Tax=Stieleria neptunia TaxID=2527979 RepID=A0A518I0A2_9BACT|nr:VWA domain-containing protein [Stieleria neptunia]QDV46546.1 von Willebrand factor type A domain protein [Stieleria neptunia]